MILVTPVTTIRMNCHTCIFVKIRHDWATRFRFLLVCRDFPRLSTAFRVFTICRIFWFISAFGKICFQHFQIVNLSDQPGSDWAFRQENKTDFEA